MQDGGDLLHFGNQGGEFFRQNRLDSVGEGFFGLVMDFDQEAIGANSDSSTGERKDFVALAGAVGRVDEDGEMAALFHGGDDGEIEGVA